MLNAIYHMTKAEKQATLNQVKFLNEACEVDQDEVMRAVTEYGIFINDLIHFNMMKCEVLKDVGMPIIPFTAEDYKNICEQKTEEESRKVLCEILTKKTKEMKMSEPQQTSMITKEDDERNNIIGGIAVDRLRSLIERIERLEEEKAAIASDIRDVFAEAKSAGFDVKILRACIKLRKMRAADRDEQEYLIETYRKALDI